MKRKSRRMYVLLTVILTVAVGYISYGPDKLDIAASDVVQMEISDEASVSMVITNQEDIDRIITSFNSCRKKMIEPRLIGSSVPPYFIRFHLHDGSIEELRFIPKELDSAQHTAIMSPLEASASLKVTCIMFSGKLPQKTPQNQRCTSGAFGR